ncbi:ZIP family metal transporter [Alicyclobacillus pomorum]|uniref:ZIP family metal transporter n=1 Tax=Alicyclobacillus pomorum TaxID=204470 RepID=UPI0003F66E2A|nr:ZIP family metal transporter [Alicyclobacillus pomorum]
MLSVGLTLVLCIAAAFADVIGGAIIVLRRLTERQILWTTALGAGFLIGATFLDRLPDAVSELPTTAPLYLVIGYLAMLLLHQFGAGHAHENHASVAVSQSGAGDVLHAPADGPISLSRKTEVVTFVGMIVHTFMDGVIVAGAFDVNLGTGVLMFLAITLHKIPEGFSMATISLAAGESRKTALAAASGLAVSTLVGAALTLWAGKFDMSLVKVIMALATGTFIFISTTGIVPSLKASGERRVVYVVILGVVLFYLSLRFVQAIGLQ